VGVIAALAVDRRAVWGSSGHAGMEITYLQRRSSFFWSEGKYPSTEVTARASKRV